MIKQVILVRTDLDMSVGKTAAQACHASLMASETARNKNSKWYNEWKLEGQKKVVLAVDSATKLNDKYKEAKGMKLPAEIVRDAGMTELKPGTKTAVAIGPAPENEIDKITGSLPLLK